MDWAERQILEREREKMMEYDESEDESEGIPEESSEARDEPSPIGPAMAELRQRIEAQKARMAAPPAVPRRPALPVKTAPVLLRGVEFDAAVPSRVNEYDPPVPRLDLAPPREELPATDDQTGTLLNAIIGECHFMMREVAFRSMCQADVLEDRRLWANTAMDFARTGAKVANSVASLRHGIGVKETRHTTIIQNQVAAQVVGGGGPSAR